jgi:hypothetical protein
MPLYLYGHYDSRGGATLIEAENREQADHAYLTSFGMLSFMATEEWNTPEHRAEFINEEFITEVNALESHRTIEKGEDIEYGPTENTNKYELARAFEDGLAWADEEVVETTANPFMEILWWNEDTKTFRLCEPGVNPRHPEKKEHAANASYSTWPKPPVEEGWRRSNFGEDACGVIYTDVKTLIDQQP